MLARTPLPQIPSPQLMAMILRLRQKLKKIILLTGLGLATLSTNGCDAIYWNEESSVSFVQAYGELVVLTTASPIIYLKPSQGESFGVDYDLLQSFARHYNLRLRYVTLPDEDAVLEALSQGQGDIAAARLRVPPENSNFLLGPAYDETNLSLYCDKKARVQNAIDLNLKKVGILKRDADWKLPAELHELAPEIELQTVQNMKVKNLLGQIPQRKVDCVIAENFSGDFHSRHYPQIEKITTFSETYSLNWLLTAKHSHLSYLMRSWFQKASRNDEVMRVMDRYKGYLEKLDRQDISKFFRMIRTTLPSYRQTFKEAATQHGLPWQLVASVAYQESHWNPDARSFTGVMGLMQLTTSTALHLGVEDRNDPEQSIWGGAKYLRQLINSLPKDLNSKDRLALALAAYNVGSAHLKDAQKLAIRMGKNPHSWRHMREILPLLANPVYAAELQYGPARGYETVDFVERVKSFYSLMRAAG